MGRKMILTLKRGQDVFCFFSEALAQQVLGLDISSGGGSTGLGGGKGKVDRGKDKGRHFSASELEPFDISATDDVSMEAVGKKKKKRPKLRKFPTSEVSTKKSMMPFGLQSLNSCRNFQRRKMTVTISWHCMIS